MKRVDIKAILCDPVKRRELMVRVIVGTTAQVRFEKIHVLRNVLDSRYQWGRTDLLVEPVDGSGSQWIERSRVQEAR